MLLFGAAIFSPVDTHSSKKYLDLDDESASGTFTRPGRVLPAVLLVSLFFLKITAFLHFFILFSLKWKAAVVGLGCDGAPFFLVYSFISLVFFSDSNSYRSVHLP